MLCPHYVQSKIEAAFTSLSVIGTCLLVTGTILFLADWAGRRAKRHEVRLFDSIFIGLAQALALLPGISRSGSTIATGMALGIRGTETARFSFLLSIPAILGAGALKVIQAFSTGSIPAGEWAGLLLGALTAGAVGALAIKGLLAVIARGRLKVFGIYCLAVGASVLIWLFVVSGGVTKS